MTQLRRWAAPLVVIAAFAPIAASAQTETSLNGSYISLSGLYVSPVDSDLSTTGGGYTLSTDLEMDGGFGMLIAFGYGADVGLRGEVELGYRKNDFDKLNGGTLRGPNTNISVSGKFPYKGDVATLSLMANGIYAFEAGRLRPYFGVGLGLARHDATEDAQTVTIGGETVEYPKSSDEDTVFAYQAMAGIAFPMSDTMEARIGYRYFATADADFDGTEASYGTHNIEAGILIRF